MFPAASPGDISRRAPAEDDLDGLDALYGTFDQAAPDAQLTVASCPLGIRIGTGDGDPSIAGVDQVVAVHSQSGEQVLLGRPNASTGVLSLEVLAVEALTGPAAAPGPWDLTLQGPEGKTRTTFALFTLPEVCEEPPLPGCACGGGGVEARASDALLFLLVSGLGLGSRSRGRGA